MTIEELLKIFPDYVHKKAVITVDLMYDKVESDDSIKSAIEQELNCCHCVHEINGIELTD